MFRRATENEYAVTGLWSGEFDERRLEAWASDLRGRLRADKVSLGLVFMTPDLLPSADAIVEVFRVHAQVPLLAGCSSPGLIEADTEAFPHGGLVLALYALPEAQLHGVHFSREMLESLGSVAPSDWRAAAGVPERDINGWLLFGDPFSDRFEGWLDDWSDVFGSVPTFGGLAGVNSADSDVRLFLNGAGFDEGAVGIAFSGRVGLAGVVSQGCTPIGEGWTVTKAEGNVIFQIGNRPAYEVLVETFNSLPADMKGAAPGNLFLGLALNEYVEDFGRGDFLVRNLIGADPKSGALAVGARPRLGQTVQFQLRSPRAATEDLAGLLDEVRRQIGIRKVYGGCLCSCTGRGSALFGVDGHDAQMVQDFLGPLGLSGFFCSGEIGPVGDKLFLHGYTASLALFVEH